MKSETTQNVDLTLTYDPLAVCQLSNKHFIDDYDIKQLQKARECAVFLDFQNCSISAE